MTRQAQDTSVRVEIVVEAAIEEAFAVFTEGIGTWFPPEYNLLPVPIAERIFEPRAGGRVYDRGTDGSECHWGDVLAYEPPDRVVISWNISPRWEIITDAAQASEVEVRFVALDDGRTRVELEHRYLERHGPGWEGVRDGVDGSDGWPRYLARFDALVGSVDV